MTMQDLEKIEIEPKEKRHIRPDTGFTDEDRTVVAGALRKVLADSYAFMIMCHNYHWNVRGTHFKEIHEITEEQYEDVFYAIDDIAERIRALGHLAPGTMKEFNDLTTVNLPNSELSEREMIADLLQGNEELSRGLKDARKVAEKIEDEVTVDLLIDRTREHEKKAWMYRSMMEK